VVEVLGGRMLVVDLVRVLGMQLVYCKDVGIVNAVEEM
jgi:hypothetical protein